MGWSGHCQPRIHRRVACGLVVAAVVAGGTAPAVHAESGNLVVNPEANTGLEDWNAKGWGVVEYGASPNVPPKTPTTPKNLFEAGITGATMSQDVSFAQDTAAIEAGAQPISAFAKLGAAGSGEEGAQMLVQPERANGEPLGSETMLGPPTAGDRQDQATLLSCWVNFTAPVGMRSLLVTIVATGAPGQPSTAMADSISASDVQIAIADIGGAGYLLPAQGQNCYAPGPPWHRPRVPLARVLHACKTILSKRKRQACIRAAHKRYGTAPQAR